MQADQLERINEQAREWFTLMQSGSVTEAERAELQAWLAADHAHVRAYGEYEAIWQTLGDLKHTRDYAALKNSTAPGFFEKISGFFSGLPIRKPAVQWSAALASAAILCAAILLKPAEKITIDTYATATGEIKQLALQDGSQITLGAKSQLKTWFTKDERHVELMSGQAFFKVSKNPQRPFLVDAGETKVRVLGTQFDVRRGSDRTRVAVLEGVVRVSSVTKAVDNPAVTLTANQQVIHHNEGPFEAINTISVSELESWRNGRLIYLRASLADVVADANRYFKGTISLGSKNLADLKVTAAVSTDQMDSLTDMISKSLPVELHKDAQNNIQIIPRQDPEPASK